MDLERALTITTPETSGGNDQNGHRRSNGFRALSGVRFAPESRIVPHKVYSEEPESNLEIYFSDINQFGNLTLEKEQNLVQTLHIGQIAFASLLNNSRALPPDESNILQNYINTSKRCWIFEEKCLQKKLSQTDGFFLALIDNSPVESRVKMADAAKQAAETLINHHLRLVLVFAKLKAGKGYNLLDMIQAGNEGLLKAILKYDQGRGARVSTFAKYQIIKAINLEAASMQYEIREPVYFQITRKKIQDFQAKFQSANGRLPTPQEVAKSLGIPLEQISDVNKFSYNIESLETPTPMEGEENGATYADLIEDKNPTANPETYALHQAATYTVAQLTKNLSDRESKVLKLRSGLEDDSPRTLEEIGREFQVTRARIHQIVGKIKKKLQADPLLSQLAETV